MDENKKLEHLFERVLDLTKNTTETLTRMQSILEGTDAKISNEVRKDIEEVKTILGRSNRSIIEILEELKLMKLQELQGIKTLGDAVSEDKINHYIQSIKNIDELIAYLNILSKSAYSESDIISLGKVVSDINKIASFVAWLDKWRVVILLAFGLSVGFMTFFDKILLLFGA